MDDQTFYIVVTKKELGFILTVLQTHRARLNRLLEKHELTDHNADEMEASIDRINDTVHTLLTQRARQKDGDKNNGS